MQAVSVQLEGGHGWNGKEWQAGFITNDVSDKDAEAQITAIKSMSFLEAYDNPTNGVLPTITLTLTASKIVNNKIIIGVRRDNSGLQYVGSCSATINGTLLQKTTTNVSYNQGAGNIVAYSGTYKTPPAPAQVNAFETDQITIAPLSPTIISPVFYQLVFNETQAPSNKSFWQKQNASGFPIQEINQTTHSFPAAKSEDNWKYEAQ